jgi:hypothetical protein
MPMLKNPPEMQDWDIALWSIADWHGHTATSLLNYNLLEQSDFRWINYDERFENMFKKMSTILERREQEKKMCEIVRYVYDRAYFLFIYSPLSLYAVNKEVNFVPQRCGLMCVKETSVTENHWSLRGKNNSK